MAMNFGLLGLDRSRCSDKSSDSGGLLDLSSKTAGGNEDTWLFEMEAKMKDMELIEEEKIPDDLLDISLDDDDSGCQSDSLNDQDLSNGPALLDINSSPPHDQNVVNLPSAPIADVPLAPSASAASLETTSDPKALLDDFGFNIKFSPAHTDKELPNLVTDEGGSSKKSANPQSLLDDFGFENGSSASQKGENLPTTDGGDKLTSELLRCSETITNGHSLLKDFGNDKNVPVSHKIDSVPNTENVDTPLTSPPSIEQQESAQSLLDDFGFDTKLPTSTIDKVSPTNDCTFELSSGQGSSDASAQEQLNDFGFDTKLSASTASPSEQGTTDAHNLLDDFGFDSKLPAVEKVSPDGQKTCTPSLEQGTVDAQNLLDFGFDSKLPAPSTVNQVSPSTQNTRTPSSEHNTDAQNLLDDFGFDTTHPTTSHVVTDPSSDNTMPQSSDENKDTPGNLLDDFGFESAPRPTKGEVSVPNTHVCTGDNLLTPLSPSGGQSSCIGMQNLLDDFGFDINVSAPSSAKESTSSQAKSSPSPPQSAEPKAVKQVQPVVPLIAFSDDVVRLWQTKKEEKSDQSHPKSTSCDKSGSREETCDGDSDLEADDKQESCTEVGDVGIAATVVKGSGGGGGGCDGEEMGYTVIDKKASLRLQTRLNHCSPFLPEAKEDINTTFDVHDGSPLSLDVEQVSDVIGVHPSSSDGMLSVMQSNGSAEELHQRSVSPSLNSSLSSEHSQASSVCSSLSTTSKESRGDTSGLENGPGTTRRIGGKIPKPASKIRPSIKASLLPSKSATTLSKASGGAVSKMPPPNSRLMKPKSVSHPTTSLKSGLAKTKQSSSIHRLGVGTSKTSRLTKMAATGGTVKQPAVQGLRGQPRSKLAVPAALKKKKPVNAENPTTMKFPLTSSTPLTSSDPTEAEKTSPTSGNGKNDTFTLSSAATSPTADVHATPKTSKEGRRSLIPTPAQENKVEQTKQLKGAGGRFAKGVVSSRVFKPRNGPNHSNGFGPLKSKGYSFNFDAVTDVPPLGSTKVVHSPLDKENRPATPHSKWSPIRRKKPLNFEEACIQCTKKVK